MSAINSFNDYSSRYNTNQDYTYLFSGMTSGASTSGSSFNLGDYAAIKNGSYGKLLKAYYAKQDAEKGSATEDSRQKSVLIQSSADTLKKSADALNTASLWEKKKITKTDEKTGEKSETEDYDFDAITKAVQSFVDNYNDVIEEAAKSDSKDVLRNAMYMTNYVSKNEKLLSKAGITIGKGNKLELDADTLKKADISTLKTLFSGHNSLADRVAQKADAISIAASRGNSIYTRNGAYSNTLSSMVSGKVDEEV